MGFPDAIGATTRAAAASGEDALVIANREYYDRHAADYEAFSWYFWNRYKRWAMEREVAWLCHRIRGRQLRVLDVGCGTGYLTLQFLEHGAEVTALDISSRMLDALRAKVPARRHASRLTTICGRLEDAAPAPGAYDIVAESSVLHHIIDYPSFVVTIAKHLAPGGYLYLLREPLHREEAVRTRWWHRAAYRALTGVDRGIAAIHGRRGKYAFKKHSPDPRFIAYHMFRDGVALQAILAALNRTGTSYDVVRARRYNRRFSPVLSFLENHYCAALRADCIGDTLFAAVLRQNEIEGSGSERE